MAWGLGRRMSDADQQISRTSATVNHVALVAGSKIGRYEILAVLGQGGFGITYRARDTQLNREVAIKEYLPTVLAIRQNGSTVLPLSTAVTNDFIWGRERFIEEGRTLATLHEAPAIVRVFNFLEENGTAYIVMDVLRGQTLERKVRHKGPLSYAEVDALLRPLLDGLQHVHQAGFLHRDIKPPNVLRNDAGRPTLIDFGAARAAMVGRTTVLTAILTPSYAAPEQFTSAKQGPWTDIYGLSATLYCAITGEAPPKAFDRVLQDVYQPLAQRSLPGFPRELLAALDAGLALYAAQRPQSIAAWRSLLEEGSKSRGRSTVAKPQPQPRDQPELRVAAADVRLAKPLPSRLAPYLGVAVVVGALAGGGYFALRPTPPPDLALRDAKVEDLEKQLEEYRKADAAVAEKRRLEAEAQRKAAEQKAQAEAAARQAAIEEARRKAEAEAAVRRQIEEEVRRKIDAEAAARRQAEDEARRKAAEAAEAKRLADEALAKAQAERQRADEEAQRKAQAEAGAKVDADARKAGEVAENGLRLTPADRQRLQVALTSLGFDTRGYDGAFGPRTRDMIAGWQKARNLPPTGFLNASQQQALLREAAAALARYDEQKKRDEQKKLDDERRKTDEARRKAEEQAPATSSAPPADAFTPTPVAPFPPPPVAAATGYSSFDGAYQGNLTVSIVGMSSVLTASLQLRGGRLTGSVLDPRCGTYGFAATVSPSGEISGALTFMTDQICSSGRATVSGRIGGNQLQLDIRAGSLSASGSLIKGGG